MSAAPASAGSMLATVSGAAPRAGSDAGAGAGKLCTKGSAIAAGSAGVTASAGPAGSTGAAGAGSAACSGGAVPCEIAGKAAVMSSSAGLGKDTSSRSPSPSTTSVSGVARVIAPMPDGPRAAAIGSVAGAEASGAAVATATRIATTRDAVSTGAGSVIMMGRIMASAATCAAPAPKAHAERLGLLE